MESADAGGEMSRYTDSKLISLTRGLIIVKNVINLKEYDEPKKGKKM